MAELLQDYDYMISDIDRQYNRVSGIFYDCLGAGLTVYAHALPFLNDVSRYASVERVDFGEYNAKKIRITLEGAGRYNRDFVTSWRHFIYGEAG